MTLAKTKLSDLACRCASCPSSGPSAAGVARPIRCPQRPQSNESDVAGSTPILNSYQGNLTMPEPSTTKIIIDFVTLLLGVSAFLRAMYVYRQQKHRDHELAEASDRLKRFEKFQEMQRRFSEDKSIARVLIYLYPDMYPGQKDEASERISSSLWGFMKKLPS